MVGGVIVAVVVIAGVFWLLTVPGEGRETTDNYGTQPAQTTNSTNQSTTTMEQSKQGLMSIADQNQIPKFTSVTMETTLGTIEIELLPEKAPVTVANFGILAQQGFYDGTAFHRVIKDFMIQGGDPLSKDDTKSEYWGTGGPDYRFRDEFNDVKLVKGVLAMANSGANTNGSQFFIVTADATPWLDGKHTAFGRVTKGMDIVEKIETTQVLPGDRPATKIVVNKVSVK